MLLLAMPLTRACAISAGPAVRPRSRVRVWLVGLVGQMQHLFFFLSFASILVSSMKFNLLIRFN
jgi:hypothetical protein